MTNLTTSTENGRILPNANSRYWAGVSATNANPRLRPKPIELSVGDECNASFTNHC
jgi:hypothetical protein